MNGGHQKTTKRREKIVKSYTKRKLLTTAKRPLKYDAKTSLKTTSEDRCLGCQKGHWNVMPKTPLKTTPTDRCLGRQKAPRI